jgi:hypothetical protein
MGRSSWLIRAYHDLCVITEKIVDVLRPLDADREPMDGDRRAVLLFGNEAQAARYLIGSLEDALACNRLVGHVMTRSILRFTLSGILNRQR